MISDTLATVLINLISVIPPTLMAWAVLSQARRTDKKADAITQKQESLIIKTDEIGTSTDGNLAAVRADLVKSNAEITKLNETVAQLVKEATKSDDIISRLKRLDEAFRTNGIKPQKP